MDTLLKVKEVLQPSLSINGWSIGEEIVLAYKNVKTKTGNAEIKILLTRFRRPNYDGFVLSNHITENGIDFEFKMSAKFTEYDPYISIVANYAKTCSFYMEHKY